MGKTSKPTRILVLDPIMLEWPEITGLMEQGHHVSLHDAREFDLILGPHAWRMDDDLRPYLLSHSLPEARRMAERRKATQSPLEDLRKKKGPPAE